MGVMFVRDGLAATGQGSADPVWQRLQCWMQQERAVLLVPLRDKEFWPRWVSMCLPCQELLLKLKSVALAPAVPCCLLASLTF